DRWEWGSRREGRRGRRRGGGPPGLGPRDGRGAGRHRQRREHQCCQIAADSRDLLVAHHWYSLGASPDGQSEDCPPPSYAPAYAPGVVPTTLTGSPSFSVWTAGAITCSLGCTPASTSWRPPALKPSSSGRCWALPSTTTKVRVWPARRTMADDGICVASRSSPCTWTWASIPSLKRPSTFAVTSFVGNVRLCGSAAGPMASTCASKVSPGKVG